MSSAASFDSTAYCHGSTQPTDQALQIALDSFNDNTADPYIYKCSGSSAPNKGGTTIAQCFSPVTLCIGAHGQQHACVVENDCYHVDWTGERASSCSDGLLQYVSIQKPGFNAPCCSSEFCTKATSSSGIVQIQCEGTGRQLWLCVNDGGGVECVRPVDNVICSGNFTGTVHSESGSGTVTSGGHGSTAAATTSGGPKPTDTSSDSGSGMDSSTKVKIIVSSVLAGAAVIILLGVYCLRRRKQKTVGRIGGVNYPDSYGKHNLPLTTYDPQPISQAAANQSQNHLLDLRSTSYTSSANTTSAYSQMPSYDPPTVIDTGGGNLGPSTSIYGGSFTSPGRDHNVNQGAQYFGGVHYHQ